jgi:hypothetical protein
MTRKDFRRTYGNTNGAIVYAGPSRIDGAAIVAIVTGTVRASENDKTGDMLQLWILRSDMSPVDAVQTGADYSVCGTCPHRGTVAHRTCYVDIGKAPRGIFEAYRRGRYVDLSGDMEKIASVGEGHAVRLGAYGDPAAVPAHILQALISRATRTTGYTHQWRRADLADVTALCMASADSAADYVDATAAGYRTFRVRSADESLQPGEIVCPASEEAGKRTECAACGLCAGLRSKAKNIAIIVHGAGRRNFRRADLPTLGAIESVTVLQER